MSATLDLRADQGPSDADDLEVLPGLRRLFPSLADWRRLTPRARAARAGGALALSLVALAGPHPLKGIGPSFALDVGLVYCLVVLAVSVLGWIGEISLAVVAQMGFGLIAIDFLQEHGWPFGLILLGVVVSSIPVSLVVGIFALRLRGVSFVIASLALGYLAQRSILAEYLGAGASDKGEVGTPRYLAAHDRFYYWLLASLVIVAGACYLVQRSRLGRAITAMRDSETAFWTLGHSPARYKLFTVCLSGAIATLAGAYYAMLLVRVPALYYQPGLAIVFFGFALAGGMGSIGGSIAAGLFFGALPKYLEAYTSGGFSRYDFFFYGLFSLLIFMKVPGGLGGLGRRLWARLEGPRG
ncbi:MAG: branched-chain amino acid transport system permease protein [Actinomycetota bacterium]|nr:branched-chain amino acid transport system permease protein [Actinomycetota bacterium]